MKFVKINAVWCPSCIITNKVWKKLMAEDKSLNVEELDYDFDEEEVEKYNVGDILPVVIALDNDQELGRLIGEKTKEEIEEFINKYR